uniref:Uncharacterized protein n=1 Tax=Anguilla anguilla TaxID=7936 RepID=A0A0E9UL68_ANGAN
MWLPLTFRICNERVSVVHWDLVPSQSHSHPQHIPISCGYNAELFPREFPIPGTLFISIRRLFSRQDFYHPPKSLHAYLALSHRHTGDHGR